MAANRARDAARQLKDDIKNSIRISSRSKDRTTLDAQTTFTSSGRIYFVLINKSRLKSLYFNHIMHILDIEYLVLDFIFYSLVKMIMFSDLLNFVIAFFNKIKKKERERTRILSFLWFESSFYITTFLLYLRWLTCMLCMQHCSAFFFFFISFVAFWLILFFCLLCSFVPFIVDNHHMKEMPHRIRKIVSKCRPPFIEINRKRYTHAASTHHCMCQSIVYFLS